jgi:hypothetical protein
MEAEYKECIEAFTHELPAVTALVFAMDSPTAVEQFR